MRLRHSASEVTLRGSGIEGLQTQALLLCPVGPPASPGLAGPGPVPTRKLGEGAARPGPQGSELGGRARFFFSPGRARHRPSLSCTWSVTDTVHISAGSREQVRQHLERPLFGT